MDLAHPEYVLLGENRARVLRRLATIAEPVSGRRLHQLSGIGSLRTTQRILDQLTEAGMVDVQRIGPANAYTANRKHVLWTPLQQMLSARATVEKKLVELLSAGLPDQAVCTALYGSYARDEGGSSSDIDILVVWDAPVPEAVSAEALDALAEEIQQLTGNSVQLFALTKDELAHLVTIDDPFVHSLRRDARTLTGLPIKDLLREGRQ